MVWRSFGSGLLTSWCICACTWWQYSFYGDCDSATDSERSTDCTALTWKRTILIAMTGPEQSSAIAAYQSQANSMRRSHDENGSIQMNMDSFGVIDLDLSISPDVFGLRAFDATKPVTRMLPGSSPCELRLMLPDDKLGIDGFHDIQVENLSGTPAWRSSHISPADMTSLRRRWLKAVFNTLRRRASDVERLRWDAPKRADKVFRYGGLGFCGVCNIRIYSALDAHMIASHLELGQLWRCPVTWCAVWKGLGVLAWNIPVNMTIPGQYRPSTAYITGPLQCVSNGPITFCTSFPYRPDTCSRYWPGNGPLQYGTGPVSPHTVPCQYRTGTVTLYRFGTGPIPYRYRYTVPFRYWPNNKCGRWDRNTGTWLRCGGGGYIQCKIFLKIEHTLSINNFHAPTKIY